MNKAILFSGLIRNERLFLEFLSAYKKIPQDQKHPLYFSTWVGELDPFPAVREALHIVNAHLIEQPEPNIILPGHALHQMASLDLGLTVIGPDCFVYKTRPDFANINSYLKFLEIIPSPARSSGVVYPGQRFKIYIHGYFPSQPMYINDIVFAGVSDDIRALTSWSAISSVKYLRVAPEQIIWGGAIIPRSVYLDAFFRSNAGLIFDNKDLVERQRQILLNSTLYTKVLAFYFDILDGAFANLDPHIQSFFDFSDQLTLEQCLWEPTEDIPCMGHHINAHVNTLQSVDFVRAVKGKLLRPSPLLDAVAGAMESIPSVDTVSNTEISKSALGCSRDIGIANASIGLHGYKVPSGDSHLMRVGGSSPEWRQVGARTERVAELEQEVNQLRRTVERLMIQIKGGLQ